MGTCRKKHKYLARPSCSSSSHRSCCDHHHPPTSWPPKKCRALCCGGSTDRLSVSSSSTTGDDDVGSSPCVAAADKAEAEFGDVYPAEPSRLAHELVQERLEQILIRISKEKQAAAAAARGIGTACSTGSRCVVLVALDKESYDPRGDFRKSMLEVITSNATLQEPRELRLLLNCYMSMNPGEHRVVILEAFHEVCASLFSTSVRRQF